MKTEDGRYRFCAATCLPKERAARAAHVRAALRPPAERCWDGCVGWVLSDRQDGSVASLETCDDCAILHVAYSELGTRTSRWRAIHLYGDDDVAALPEARACLLLEIRRVSACSS